MTESQSPKRIQARRKLFWGMAKLPCLDLNISETIKLNQTIHINLLTNFVNSFQMRKDCTSDRGSLKDLWRRTHDMISQKRISVSVRNTCWIQHVENHTNNYKHHQITHTTGILPSEETRFDYQHTLYCSLSIYYQELGMYIRLKFGWKKIKLIWHGKIIKIDRFCLAISYDSDKSCTVHCIFWIKKQIIHFYIRSKWSYKICTVY